MSTTNTETAPSQRPPQTDGGAGAGSGGPSEPGRPPEQGGAQGGARTATAAAGPQGGPALQPPGSLAATASGDVAAVTATWQTSTVTGLWCINETRNAWIVANGAWRKIYNGRDGAFTALVTLASQARATGRSINYRQEADGMVYEIYLW